MTPNNTIESKNFEGRTPGEIEDPAKTAQEILNHSYLVAEITDAERALRRSELFGFKQAVEEFGLADILEAVKHVTEDKGGQGDQLGFLYEQLVPNKDAREELYHRIIAETPQARFYLTDDLKTLSSNVSGVRDNNRAHTDPYLVPLFAPEFPQIAELVRDGDTLFDDFDFDTIVSCYEQKGHEHTKQVLEDIELQQKHIDESVLEEEKTGIQVQLYEQAIDLEMIKRIKDRLNDQKLDTHTRRTLQERLDAYPRVMQSKAERAKKRIAQSAARISDRMGSDELRKAKLIVETHFPQAWQ